MESTLDILGVGYPSLDYMMKIKETPKIGQTTTILSENLAPNYGGCVINITYLLAELGFNCGVYMTVGKDFEESGFKSFLEKQNISLKFTQIDDKYLTSYTYLLQTPDGEHITLFHPGAMNKNDSLYTKNFNINDTKFGLITIGELTSNKFFLNECIKNSIPIIFSMKGDYSSLDIDYLEKILQHSQLIFMNEFEYHQLNKLLDKKIIEYLQDNKVFVITLGSKGSVILTNKNKLFVSALEKVNVVDTTGGGDAFIAGFLYGYLNNQSLRDSAEIGTALSSFIIEKVGCLTNIPSKSDLLVRKEKIGELYNNDTANIILRAYQ